MTILTGQVMKVRRQIENWCVFDFRTEQINVSVAGNLCGLEQVVPGVHLTLFAEQTKHPKYGIQFVPYGWDPPERADKMETFLLNCVEGFDREWVGKIVNAFGDRTAEVLTKEPLRVIDLAGEDEGVKDRLQRATLLWDKARARSSLSVFLHDFQVSPRLVEIIAQRLGAQALEVLRSNPYRLAGMDSGIDFGQIDRLALKLGVLTTDIRRLQGGILWVLRHVAPQEGHVHVPAVLLPEFLDGLSRQDTMEPFVVNPQRLKEALQQLVSQHDVVLKDGNVYLPDYYHFEQGSASMLARMLANPVKLEIDFDAFLQDYERGHRLTLSDAQRDGLFKVIHNQVLVITGLPGTGKTSLVRAIVQLLQRVRVRHILMAPTGVAAKRLASVTHTEAATVHRQFQCDPTGRWGYGGAVKYSTEAAIVDEMSMVDQQLFFRILDAIGSETRLILVGDDAQLPSVGPGNVLREVLNCPLIPHVRLTKIFRQADTSEIVDVSHKINNGEVPDLSEAKKGEFRFVPVASEEEILRLIVEMAKRLKSKDASFQVLSPKYAGTVGVKSLNDALREALNPEHPTKKEWRGDLLHVRQGDRVMVIQNDYKRGIYNGDMGKLIRVNHDSLLIRIHGLRANDPGMEVLIPHDEAEMLLKLAYALRVRHGDHSHGPVTRSDASA
jgi:exodeoxyribonuclease V alpha subunit